jgi:hypothetical protein
MLVGVQTTLNASYDGGCQWATVLGNESVDVFDDAISRSDPSIVVALVGIYEAGGISYALQRSRDHGKTWEPPGPRLPVDSAYTIDIDPHDPSRLYLTGLVANEGRFAVSTDAGTTWTAYPISGTSVGGPPRRAGGGPRAWRPGTSRARRSARATQRRTTPAGPSTGVPATRSQGAARLAGAACPIAPFLRSEACSPYSHGWRCDRGDLSVFSRAAISGDLDPMDPRTFALHRRLTHRSKLTSESQPRGCCQEKGRACAPPSSA